MTPIGKISLFASPIGLCKVEFEDNELIESKSSIIDWFSTWYGKIIVIEKPNSFLLQAKQELDDYFQQKRSNFQLSFDLNGTLFQKRVWKQLLQISYGKTASYSEIAYKIGNSNASRAVGNANAKNPLPIFIPCHRVIRKNGALGGFSAGLSIKTFLLKLEKNLKK